MVYLLISYRIDFIFPLPSYEILESYFFSSYNVTHCSISTHFSKQVQLFLWTCIGIIFDIFKKCIFPRFTTILPPTESKIIIIIHD